MRLSLILTAVAMLVNGLLPDRAGAQGDTRPPADLPPTVPAEVPELSASDLMGKQVVDAVGGNLGQVSDVIVNAETGAVDRLVISSGGVWGLGDDVVAVEFDDVILSAREGKIIAPGLTKSEIERYSEGAGNR